MSGCGQRLPVLPGPLVVCWMLSHGQCAGGAVLSGAWLAMRSWPRHLGCQEHHTGLQG